MLVFKVSTKLFVLSFEIDAVRTGHKGRLEILVLTQEQESLRIKNWSINDKDPS